MTTTLELPIAVRDRLRSLKAHPRQAYHEVISAALDAWQAAGRPAPGRPGLDPLVARHRKAILAAARRNRARRLWLFGSRARGEGRPDSDVDLLVEFEPGASLFDHAAMQADLQGLLEVEVDTVSLGGLKGALRDRVLAERVAL